jgi:uncharacterized membrane protein YkoI
MFRKSIILVLAMAAAVSNAQSLATAANNATAAAPGFIFKSEIITTNKLVWDFRIAGTDHQIHRVIVDVATDKVLRNRIITMSSMPVSSAPVDFVAAGTIAENAIASIGDEGTFFEGQCRVKSNNRFYWELELMSNSTEGLLYEVKIDAATGKIVKLDREFGDD